MNPSFAKRNSQSYLNQEIFKRIRVRKADLEKLFAKQITLRKGAPAIVWKNH